MARWLGVGVVGGGIVAPVAFLIRSQSSRGAGRRGSRRGWSDRSSIHDDDLVERAERWRHDRRGLRLRVAPQGRGDRRRGHLLARGCRARSSTCRGRASTCRVGTWSWRSCLLIQLPSRFASVLRSRSSRGRGPGRAAASGRRARRAGRRRARCFGPPARRRRVAPILVRGPRGPRAPRARRA